MPITVESFMTRNPRCIEDSTPVGEAYARKLGSAIVADKNRVVGIFTTSDALQAFASLLRRSVMEDRQAAIRSAGIID